MSDYNGSTLESLSPATPADSEFVGVAAAALRQIKRVMLSKDVGGLEDYINGLIDKKLETDRTDLYKKLYAPKGQVYFTLDPDDDPAVTFGGTWKKIEGKFIIGADADNPAGTESTGLIGASIVQAKSGSLEFTGSQTGTGTYGYVMFSNGYTIISLTLPWATMNKYSNAVLPVFLKKGVLSALVSAPVAYTDGDWDRPNVGIYVINDSSSSTVSISWGRIDGSTSTSATIIGYAEPPTMESLADENPRNAIYVAMWVKETDPEETE